MKIFRYLGVCCIFAIVLTFMPVPSSACSCAAPESVQAEFERADVVFLGEVLDSYDSNKKNQMSSNDSIQYLFQVEEVWKGIDKSQVVVSSARDSASCGFKFVNGEKYVVFATQQESSIETNFCTITENLDGAADIIEELGVSSIPSETVHITLPERAEETKQDNFSFILSIPILLGLLFVGFLIAKKRKKQL